MSWQTAHFRRTIDLAKTGDQKSLRVCRLTLEGIAKGDDVPNEAIIELCECALRLGIEQGRKDAEVN